MILLTGGAGFIGSNIAADLNAAGTTDIVIADSLGTDDKWRNIAKRRFLDIVFPDEIEAFLGARDDVAAIVHMGAVSSTTARDADAIVRSNFRLSARLWNWCARERVPLIYASSAATYGDGGQGFLDDESDAALDRLMPLNLYGWSKHAFDRWAVERARNGVAPPQWAGLKFFNVYGPNEGHKGEMRSLVAKNTPLVARGETLRLFKSDRPDFADGAQARDFVYVKDCGAVVLWLLDNPGVSGLFNLATGVARSFRDLMLAVGAALDREVAFDFVAMPYSLRDQYQYFTQAEMAKLRDAGYAAPFRSIEDGVRDYVRNYLTQPDPYR
ncbi:MAG: ADP-glyceromanno-heptose 6-epimerase [Roseiarcus sp.]|jgi:ADP-L-glycero-D-manno-heptose 6-epimerase